MTVSVITTVKNEEKSIREFLDSLIHQTRMPDEIIITDGGSTDETCKIISSEYISKFPQIKLIQENCNIARGRNLAIREAKSALIAVTDGGCRVEKNWLEVLIHPLENDSTLDVTGGVTLPNARTSFEKVTGAFFTVSPIDMQNNPHLISSRNIAFRKSVWEKAGGYPEWLYLSGEDTLFDQQLQKIGAKIKIIPEAKIYWNPMPNFHKLFKQNFTYARGNGQAGFYKLLILKTVLVYLLFLGLFILSFFQPLIVVVLGVLFISYFVYSGIKLCRKVNDPSVFLLAMVIKFVIDITNIYGYITGLLLGEKHNTVKEG